jgi:hypothetical protein
MYFFNVFKNDENKTINTFFKLLRDLQVELKSVFVK